MRGFLAGALRPRDTIAIGSGNVFVFGAGAGADSYPGGDGWSESADLEAGDGPGEETGEEGGEEGGEETGAGSRTLKVAEGNELSFEDEEKLEW